MTYEEYTNWLADVGPNCVPPDEPTFRKYISPVIERVEEECDRLRAHVEKLRKQVKTADAKGRKEEVECDFSQKIEDLKMAIPQKVQNRTDEIVAACKTTKNLSLSDRDDYIAIMTEACEGTNGISPEEKLQANAVNIANLCYLFIRDKLEGQATGFWPSLFRLLYLCRWQITIIALGAFVLFGYRPEIVDAIRAALGK